MKRTRSSPTGRALLGLCLFAAMALAVAACGSSTDSGEDSSATTAGDAGGTTTTVSGDPLGEPNAAEGEPIKIGLIGTGGDCADCTEGGAVEEPVAQATADWANDYLGGIAGRPIELVVCNNDLDPSKATDCANQMIAEDAAAVVLGADSTVTGWQVLHDAGIPVVNFSTTQAAMLADPDSTFVLQGSEALTVEFPIGAAQQIGADKVSIIVIDLPAATDIYTDEVLQKFADAGLDVEIIPVPIGTPDMTPQAQQIVQNNPDGLVNIVGHDAFCIPAINGLQAAGFTGTIATISFCVTDALREAVSSDMVEGILLGASNPVGDESDPSTQQYEAVLDEYGDDSIARDSSSGFAMFSSVAALAIGTAGLEGEVTPESIIDAMRSMDNEVLPGTGGRFFRCNGNAETSPAVCMSSGLSGTLGADGLPVSYEAFNNVEIPD